jgi:hypothetical protein
LGDACFGFCNAALPGAGASFTPPEEHQRELCNSGYARGVCEHFPASGAADAVRFSITEDSGDRLRVVYILERDHAPLRHGILDFPNPEAPASDELLLRQARVFVENYLTARNPPAYLSAGFP